MNHRQRKKLKGTLNRHDTRLEYVEARLHEEILSKWLIRGFVGLIMLLLGGFYDLIAPFLLKTRFFSFSYSPEIGLAQSFLMGMGAILLIISACMYEQEIKSYVGKH